MCKSMKEISVAKTFGYLVGKFLIGLITALLKD